MDMAVLDRPRTPWHPGEIALQRSVGAADRMAEVGPRIIRDHLIDQHRDFYPLLPFVVIGTVDPGRNPWASLRAGPPGFLAAPDRKHLTVALARDTADPAEAGLEDGDAVGLLGIDLSTRRRNRLNGTLRRSRDTGFEVEVEESFGNCPRYITVRSVGLSQGRGDRPEPAELRSLDGRAAAMIGAADTMFVASFVDLDGRRRVDVSHRGGRPGFVRLDRDGSLTIPDFAGNLFFNTLGNILTNPKAGLVFPDFATGDLLQLTGDAEIVPASPEVAVEGAERLWRVHPRRIVLRRRALAIG